MYDMDIFMDTITAQKQAQLNVLYAQYAQCMACPLATLGRTTIVFGQGNANAKLMLIGEGPGQQEDAQGKPFVGKSGQLLTKILSIVGIARPEIYITNIVKCRPPNNRRPAPLETSTCKKLLLLKQIEIINPTIICTLGACAIESLLEQPISISRARGTIMQWQQRILIPTFHPAYILRNPKMLEFMVQDFLNAKKELESLLRQK
jgi:uracil-DNA glycosylase family 4